MRSRAATLVELMVAMAIACVLSVVVYRGYQLAIYMGGTSSESYLLSQEMATAVTRMRQDLTETSLVSIAVGDSGTSFSLASPRDLGGQVSWSEHGVVQWESNIFYSLESVEGNTGKLTRWTAPRETADKRIPLPFPGAHPQDSTGRKTVVSSLLRPGLVVSERGEVTEDAKARNALLDFVRRDGSQRTLSSINPTSRSDYQRRDWSLGTTGLVEVSLRILEEEGRSRNSYLEVEFVVRPEN
jgi:prepilin-type N-terminal cleavage/methylation domain-containing protein